MKISIDVFDSKSIDKAIKQLEDYEKDLDRKAQELCSRLADMGAVNVSLGFARAIYDGTPDFNVEVVQLEGGKYSVKASGMTVLFQEFGTGVYHPDNHPKAAEMGMIHGSYGKGHGKQQVWGYYGDNVGDNGWLATDSKGRVREPHVVLTHGNPANMPMYNTAQDLKREIRRVAQEVFQS